MLTRLWGNSRFTLGAALLSIRIVVPRKKAHLDLEAFPREALRRQLVDLGIERSRHRMAELIEMLPVKLNGKPYDDFDADIVAEVLVHLVGKGLIEVPASELAGLRVEWGERLCHFYRSEDELLGLVAPYFQQGLAQGERCLWLAGLAASRKARQAIAMLADRQGSPDQLEVVDDDWTPDLDTWSREEERALAQGYSGLRICGEALGLNGESAGLRMKALSTYRVECIARAELGGLIRAHQAAFVKNGSCWQRVPTADAAVAEEILAGLMA
jgi:hypothetical protein